MAQIKRVTRVKKTQAQINAELAAAKKEYEAYKKSRPSKEKIAEINKAQQSRMNRSKTNPSAPRIRRTPSTSVKTPMPKIQGTKPSERKLMSTSTRSSGVKVVLPDGSTVGLRDLGKVKPTPKPKPKVTPKTTKMTPQDEAMKKIIKKRYGW